ncbi:hypothetical protein RN001_013990 [Aquatica leii]|uniref:Uncharacterized protein n=1 Tax=Aquatica leii TaxID=1421715 RepID=A0AAN7NWX6_9COLE|nr:hypothetical protein RN001_013990 [Aquatica leii]
MRWYNEIDNDASDVGSGDENIVSGHDSCFKEGVSISGEIGAEKQELEDCTEKKEDTISNAANKSPDKVFYEKDKFKWKSEPDTPRRKTSKYNIMMNLPGYLDLTYRVPNLPPCWLLSVSPVSITGLYSNLNTTMMSLVRALNTEEKS